LKDTGTDSLRSSRYNRHSLLSAHDPDLSTMNLGYAAPLAVSGL
jgi:hypothetical protein